MVQPSAVDGGQLFSNNTSTGTPIVVIDYMSNTDIRVLDDDGFVADTDTLTLRGTNPDPGRTPGAPTGRDLVVADFNAAGNAADPMVSVERHGAGRRARYGGRRLSVPPADLHRLQHDQL